MVPEKWFILDGKILLNVAFTRISFLVLLEVAKVAEVGSVNTTDVGLVGVAPKVFWVLAMLYLIFRW